MRSRAGGIMVFAAALAIGLLPAGCGLDTAATGTEQWIGRTANRFSFRRAVDEPLTFQVARPIAIDVESFGGNVIIEADERLETARVQVVREATHGYGRAREADASLAEISYTAEIVPGALGQVLQIRAGTTHAEPNFQRAHIRIKAPEVEHVRVHTRLGRVDALDVEGVVDIRTTHGDVRMMTNRPMTRRITIINKEGDIDYRVRGESSAAFDCETVGGRVLHRVRYGAMRIFAGSDSDKLLASLNDGINPVVLRTVDADIRIAVVHNPLQIGRFIFEP